MGAYVNPPDGDKEGWLKKNGRSTDVIEVAQWKDFSKELPVVVLDNMLFLACGIAYDAKERDEFIRPDGRLRTYYIVPTDKLLTVSNLKLYLEEDKQ